MVFLQRGKIGSKGTISIDFSPSFLIERKAESGKKRRKACFPHAGRARIPSTYTLIFLCVAFVAQAIFTHTIQSERDIRRERTLQGIEMFGPRRTILMGNLPLPLNPYPSFSFPNLSLGHQACNVAIYVPLLLPEKNVREVDTHDSEKSNAIVDLGLVKSSELKGTGVEDAFTNPIKVYLRYTYTFLINISNIFFFSLRFLA